MPSLSIGVLAGLIFLTAVYIRWLHRQARKDRVQVVPTTDLWDKVSGEEGRREAEKTHIWWIVPALVCACLLAALADIEWPLSRQTQVLWVDVTPSLAALDGEGTRVEQAAVAITRALRETRAERIRLVSVQDADVSTGELSVNESSIIGGMTDLLARAPIGSPSDFPAEGAWLFSDGSASYAQSLAETVRARVIGAGEATENVGLISLSARRSLQDAATVFVTAEIYNAGLSEARRTLSLSVGTVQFESREVLVEPGESARVTANLSAADATRLRAALTPADALAVDDTILLDASNLSFTIPIDVSPDCGIGFVQAIDAMAEYIPVKQAGDLRIVCGPNPDPAADLRVWTGGAEIADSPFAWAPGILEDFGQISVSGLAPVYFRRVPDVSQNLPLWKAEDLTLASQSASGVDVFADLSTPHIQAKEQFPIVLQGLITRISGHVGGQMAQIGRAKDEIVIAPKPISTSSPPATSPGVSSHGVPWTPYLICLAGFLLCIDLIRGLRHVA